LCLVFCLFVCYNKGATIKIKKGEQKMDYAEYKEYNKLLYKNKEIRKKIAVRLLDLGLNGKLKGFLYLLGIITISVCKKKYSQTFMAEIFPYIAKREGIEVYSVQRQLRYTCTVKTNNKYLPNELALQIWQEMQKELEEERK
jgi:hypothetical protein